MITEKSNNASTAIRMVVGLALQSRLPCTDPKSGLRPEIGENGQKMHFGPTGKKRGKNGRKMGKLAQKWPKNGHFPIFRPFFPLFSVGKNPFLGHFFPISGRRPFSGSIQGNRDRKPCDSNRAILNCFESLRTANGDSRHLRLHKIAHPNGMREQEHRLDFTPPPSPQHLVDVCEAS